MFCPIGHAIDATDITIDWFDISSEEGVQITIDCSECDCAYDTLVPLEEFTEV